MRNKSTHNEGMMPMSSNDECRQNFLNGIKIEQDKELLRIKNLKKLYDEGEISEDDISEADAEKIVRLYEEEIQSIKEDTLNTKKRIRKELDELKKLS